MVLTVMVSIGGGRNTPKSNRRRWSQRVATGREHAQQNAKIFEFTGKILTSGPNGPPVEIHGW
jgi:hypothetical protein